MMRLVILAAAICFANAALEWPDPTNTSAVCENDYYLKMECMSTLKEMMDKNMTAEEKICPVLMKAYQCVDGLIGCKNETVRLMVMTAMVKITKYAKYHCSDMMNNGDDHCTAKDFKMCMNPKMDDWSSSGNDNMNGGDDMKGYDDMMKEYMSGDMSGDYMKDMYEKEQMMKEQKMKCRMGYARKMCFKKMLDQGCSNSVVSMSLNITVHAMACSLKHCSDIMGCSEKRRMKCMESMSNAKSMREKCRHVYQTMYCLRGLVDDDCDDMAERAIVSKMALPMMKKLAEDCEYNGGDGDDYSHDGAASLGVMVPLVGAVSMVSMLYN